MREEAVGSAGRIFVSDAEVVTHRVGTAELDDRRPRRLDGVGEHGRQLRRPLFGGRRRRLPSGPGHVVRCFHTASNSAAEPWRPATPVACTSHGPASVRIEAWLDGGVITRIPADRLPRRRTRSGPAADHPGMANYPADEPDYRRPRRPPPMPSANRYLPPLNHEPESDRRREPPRANTGGERVTVTRAAAQRSREMGSRMYGLVQRAATADGADKSGLTALTWPVVANFATDAAMAVALANTLFFAAATGESKDRVALYLLITIAPFAVVAPLIGPALDRLQHGRRVALAASFGLRTGLAVLLISNYDGATGSFPSWVLYPCALAMMVFSKSFSVLRSAVTPRVMPPTIDLVRVNSRLTMFGLLGGTIIGGGIASGIEYVFTRLFHWPGALFVVIAVTVAGALLSMRIPRWVEVTEGEVPTTLSYRSHPSPATLARGGSQGEWGSSTTVGPQHHHLVVG